MSSPSPNPNNAIAPRLLVFSACLALACSFMPHGAIQIVLAVASVGGFFTALWLKPHKTRKDLVGVAVGIGLIALLSYVVFS